MASDSVEKRGDGSWLEQVYLFLIPSLQHLVCMLVQSWDASYYGLHKLKYWRNSGRHWTVSLALVLHAVKQVQWCWQTVSRRYAGVRLIILIQRPQALCSMIYNSTVTHLLKTKEMRDITPYGLNCAFSEPGWMWWFLCLRIYSLRGVGRNRKAKEGGVGTDAS